MACTGRFAEFWEYASFWCLSALLKGSHDGANGAAALTDNSVDFVNFGIRANVGMTLYNLTQNTSGPVTAVTAHTLTATGVLWNTNDLFRIATVTQEEQSQIENYLDITAADVHAALAASGACDCTLASWATKLLAKLNIVEAGVFHQCPCGKPNLTEAERAAYLQWVNGQMDLLRTGKLEVCSGETGSEFPAVGWAEQSVTEFAAAKIIQNDSDRNS